MGTRTKRIRSETGTATVADVLSDCEGGVAGAAERKRELERNRRNLVNVRFVELENQLAQLPGAPTRVHRRLDKEVVLKDAAQSLAAQQRDLELAVGRIATMTAEIDILRSEKLELRHDKAYLHSEIEKARSENKALLADNTALWHALRKAGIVKLPVDLMIRPAQLLQADNERPPDTDSAQTRSQRCNATSGMNNGENERESIRVMNGQSLVNAAVQKQQDASEKVNGQGNRMMSQSPQDVSDLFANYNSPMDPVDRSVVAKPEGMTNESEDYLKMAEDFRLRGLIPSLVIPYSFEESRELSEIHMGLDDANNQTLPDIAPCG